MSDLIVNKSRLRDHLDGYRVGADIFEKVDSKLRDLLNEAAERAEANGRATVQARDV